MSTSNGAPLPPGWGEPVHVVTLGPTPDPKPLSAEERDLWMQRASMRTPPRARDVSTLRAVLRSRNRRKYDKLAELMRWAERELQVSHGLLPEDVRWLLP